MPVLQGVGTLFEQDVAYNIPSKVISCYLTNNTGSPANIVMSIYNTIDTTSIDLYVAKIISASSDLNIIPFILLPNYKIIINSDVSISYYISIE